MEAENGYRWDRVNDDIRLLQKKHNQGFGTDAYLLSAFCRAEPRGIAAEFGCGSGIISLLLAARKRYSRIFGVEIQEDLYRVAQANVAENGFSDCVKVLLCDVRELTPAAFGGPLDAVFANPPYLRTDSGFVSPHGEKQIARHELCGGMRDFALAASRCLRFGGRFYSVYRPDRLETLFSALSEAGLCVKRMVFIYDSPQKEAAMVLTEAKKGAAEGLSLLPPLFLHDRTSADGSAAPLSCAAQQIYDTGIFTERR